MKLIRFIIVLMCIVNLAFISARNASAAGFSGAGTVIDPVSNQSEKVKDIDEKTATVDDSNLEDNNQSYSQKNSEDVDKLGDNTDENK